MGETGDGKTPASFADETTWTCIGEKNIEVAQ